jgi:hypothetical protein
MLSRFWCSRSRGAAGLAALTLALVLPLASGCSEDDGDGGGTPQTYGYVSMSIQHEADGQPLVQGTPYVNAAGATYYVTKFEYLITEISLERADGTKEMLSPAYIKDLFQALPGKANEAIPAVKIPTGKYTKISFRWGRKWQGTREATETLGDDFSDLLWPGEGNVMMGDLGGGYHCMRLEGNYSSDPTPDGAFKLHMGRLHPAGYDKVVDGPTMVEIDLPNGLTVGDGETWDVSIVIDVNEFMSNPEYDFDATAESGTGRGVLPLSGPTMVSYAAQELLLANIDANDDDMYDGGPSGVFSMGAVTQVME